MTPGHRFIVKGQYIKDLSFETPGAPATLIGMGDQPHIDVNVNLRGQKLQEKFYELTMQLTVKATGTPKVAPDKSSAQPGEAANDGGKQTLFLVELSYAGIFEFIDIAPEQISAVLLVDCPFVLFPFARRVISDITRDGGFPPLMLDPIDFHGLYMRNQQDAQATA